MAEILKIGKKSDFEEGGLKYRIVDDEAGTVLLGQSYMGDDSAFNPKNPWSDDFSHYEGDKVIPETVSHKGKQYTVVGLDQGCFVGSCRVNYVVLPPTAKTIGKEAFRFCHANIIRLNVGLETIEESAFQQCRNLGEIEIPDSVKSLGACAFYLCDSLTRVTIGANVHKMESTFKMTPRLSEIKCRVICPPDLSGKTFEAEVYENAKLYVPYNSVDRYKKAPGWRQFKKILPLPYDFERDGVYYRIVSGQFNVAVVAGEKPYEGTVIIPNSVSNWYSDKNEEGSLIGYATTYTVVAIHDGAFAGSYDLKQVVLGDFVKAVGNKAFSGCPDLAYVFMNQGIATTIDDTSFDDSPLVQVRDKKIKEGDVFPIDGLSYKVLATSYDAETKRNPYVAVAKGEYKGRIEIPSTVAIAGIVFDVLVIEEFAFGTHCDKITSVTLPDNLWKIERSAFQGCKKIKEISIPASCTLIGDFAFANCVNLETVTLKDERTTGRRPVGRRNTLRDQQQLKINIFAFCFCTKIKEVISARKTPPLLSNSNVFTEETYKSATLYYMASDKKKYEASSMWARFDCQKSIDALSSRGSRSDKL